MAGAWQGVGLGRLMLQRLARHSARQGLERLVGDRLPGHRPMAAPVVALGGRFEASPNGRGVTRARFDLAPCDV